MNIELKPCYYEAKGMERRIIRGERDIYVDGEKWGHINVDYHGLWGQKYWFAQHGEAGAIGDPDDRSHHGDPRTIYVQSGGKRRRWSDADPELDRPIVDRLLDKVKELIERKLLRHPDEVLAEQKKWREKFEHNQRLAKERERKRDIDVALKIIAEHAPCVNDQFPLANAIADAIESGRSQ